TRENAQRALQSAPPQSTSVSFPVLSPSSQWLATHTLPFQKPEAQSVALLTATPRAHFAQSLPPQSTPASVASFWPSAHCSATLRYGLVVGLAPQDPEAQSRLTRQPFPTAQRVPQLAPPQSMSVSSASVTPSPHRSVEHTPLLHTEAAHSEFFLHFLPTAQL